MLLALQSLPGSVFALVTIACATAIAQTPLKPPDLLPASNPPAVVESPAEAKLADHTPLCLPPEHHPWCRFEPGAWRTLRVTTETFDSRGKSLGISVSFQTETLSQVEEEHYLLESQADVEVGGQALSGPGRRHNLHLLTDTSDEVIEAVQQPPAQINLDGHAIPCVVWRITINRNDRQLVHEIYYNDSVWPYVLRREIVETAAEDGAAPLSKIHESVIRTQVPIDLNGRIVPAAQIHSLTESAGARTERLEVHSAEVPGGFVSRSTTEWDSVGHRIRWSATELKDFGTKERTRRPLRRLLQRSRDR